jgi:hypothetical protein
MVASSMSTKEDLAVDSYLLLANKAVLCEFGVMASFATNIREIEKFSILHP